VKTVFLGTSAFAVTILEQLANSEHRPALVVTRPDRPAGRGRTLQAPPVADAARELGIPLVQPERLADPESTQQILDVQADALVVCAYGAIVKEPLLSAAPIYNVHPSLLPRWRGAAPIERAIAAGDAETGVSIMKLEEGLDSGPVALQQATPILRFDTYGTLAPRLAELGGHLLLRALDEQPPFVDQIEDGLTYAEKITAADRTLNPAASAKQNDQLVRALTPHIGARVALDDGSFLGVLEARVLPLGVPEGADPGTKPVVDDDQLHFEGTRVRLGALELTRVQPPGKTPMDAASWLRGRASR
jgi:methionyl-tRNA formyltransferase